METWVGAGELVANQRIIEQREPSCRDEIEKAHAKQLLANLPQLRRPGIEQRTQRRLSRREIRFGVESQRLYVIERTAITENHIELADAILDRVRAHGRNFRRERIPCRGFRRATPA